MTQEVAMFRSTSFALALITIGMMLLGLPGCTTYDVKRADGTELHIASTRSFPNGIDIGYTSPQGATLTIKAGTVTQPDYAGQALGIALQAIGLAAGKPLPPVAPAASTGVPLMLQPPQIASGGQ